MDYRALAEELMESNLRKKPPFTPPEDVSRGEVGILIFLTQEKNNVLAGELSKQLNLSSGRIAIALKNLEKKEFIARRADMLDKRKVIVSITEKGRLFAENGRLRCLRDTEAFLCHLGENDAKEFVRILKKINGLK